MGATLPAAGDISDATNTTAEQKDYFEDLVEILRRTPGVGETALLTEISAGTLAPSAGVGALLVNGEGTVSDILDTINVANYANGSMLYLFSFIPGNTITINHNAGGSGQISLVDATDWGLTQNRWILLRLSSTTWIEVARSFGSDTAALRTFLGLGTAATHNEGPGNGLDADTLDGSHAAAFLGVAAKAADSELLDGINSTDFVRKSPASQQDLAHNLKVGAGRFIADNVLGASAGMEGHIGGSMLGRFVVNDQASDELAMELMATPGGSLHRGLRVVNGSTGPAFYNGSSWVPVWCQQNDGAASGLDADLVHGEDGGSIFGDGGVGEYSTSFAAGANGQQQLVQVPSKMCFQPVVTTDNPAQVAAFIEGYFSGTEGVDEGVTRFRVTTVRSVGSGGALVFRCRYVAGDPPTNF